MITKRIGFIGAGKMAEAFIAGLIDSKIIEKKLISVSDVSIERINYFKSLNINATDNNKEIYKNSDIIFLSVKPNIIKNILIVLKDIINPSKLIISIAAGVKINFIENILEKNIPIVRVMPNTPVMVKSGVLVYTFNKNVNETDQKIIEEILKSVGEVMFLEEKYFDVVTGLSGSGPAYIFIVINSLAEGGVKMGLPKNIALKLAIQTTLGSAKMLKELSKHPEELLDMVTSPAGTTIDAIHSLEKNKLRASLIEAVEIATLKSIKISENLST